MTLADNAQWWKEVAEDLDKRLIAMRDECDAAVRKWELLKTGYDKEVRAAERCPICQHEWRRHDPEDGKCDAGHGLGECPCGRDIAYHRVRNATLSKLALDDGHIARAAKFGWREDHDFEREPDDGFGR